MAHAGCQENSTSSVVFQLLGIPCPPALKPFLFVAFLTVYVVTVAGNTMILVTVAFDVRLHSPMYTLLGNLATLEICYTTSIIPTLLGSHLEQGISITLPACFIQMFLFAWLTATECFLLTVMAYDRYMAICHPLRYSTLMDQKLCTLLAFSTWVIGFLVTMTNIILVSMLRFHDKNKVDHFFCDLSPVVNATCSDTSRIEMEVFHLCLIVLFPPFMLILVSYVYIISTILKIPSTEGKNKAFSTCSSHLIIVVAYFGILTLIYMVPRISHADKASAAFSLLYTIGTPLFNPIVYTLRNKEMRVAMRKNWSQKLCLPITTFAPLKQRCQKL